jgi:hypothetical protein
MTDGQSGLGRDRKKEVEPMSTRPQETTESKRTGLRVIEGGQATPAPEGRRVVAEILSDGTIRQVAEPQSDGGDRGFATGHVAGDGWTVWWDRRYWS